jgi:nitrogen regulatory protein PII
MKELSYKTIYVIVNHGEGSKVLHKAKALGIHGGTICYGKGTVKNPLMNFLSIYDERKEIVIMGAENEVAVDAMEALDKSFKFNKPNHGIMYSINVCGVVGSRYGCCDEMVKNKEGEEHMYHLIVVIVDKGKGADVVDASRRGGAKGGTIINARGSGDHNTMKVFNMEIEPEKEMVKIISKTNLTEGIISAIREDINIDKPGNGIIFVQTLNQVYGIFE